MRRYRHLSPLLLLPLLPFSVANCPADPPPIPLVALYNLTGDQSELDQPSAKGAELAVEQINQKGGILGRPLKLTVLDGRTDLATIAKLSGEIPADVPVVVGFSDTDMVKAAAPKITQSGKLFVTSGATSPKLPGELGPHFYMACYGDNEQAAAAATYLRDTLKSTNCVILVDETMEYARLLSGYFEAAFKNAGGHIVDTVRFSPEKASEAAPKVNSIGARFDSIYLACGPESAVPVIRSLREGGYLGPIFGGDSFDSPELVKSTGEKGEVYYSTHVLLTDAPKDEYSVQFERSFQKKFGEKPESAFAALAFDTIHLVAHAIEQAGSIEPAAIEKALSQMDHFPGVTGAISFAAENRVPSKPVTIVRVEGGKAVEAAVLTPEWIANP